MHSIPLSIRLQSNKYLQYMYAMTTKMPKSICKPQIHTTKKHKLSPMHANCDQFVKSQMLATLICNYHHIAQINFISQMDTGRKMLSSLCLRTLPVVLLGILYTRTTTKLIHDSMLWRASSDFLHNNINNENLSRTKLTSLSHLSKFCYLILLFIYYLCFVSC